MNKAFLHFLPILIEIGVGSMAKMQCNAMISILNRIFLLKRVRRKRVHSTIAGWGDSPVGRYWPGHQGIF